MPKAPAPPPEPTTPGILPLPEPFTRHHGKTLFGPMREWLSQKRLPPVLLLTGTQGIGKREIGHFLAQWIFCEKAGFGRSSAAQSDDGPDLFGGGGLFEESVSPAPTTPIDPAADPLPCGTCLSCQKAIRGTWVDFTEIQPDQDSDEGPSTGSLKIEQFRKLKSSMGFGAHEGSYRITLIPNADRMTVQAANSLLKLLEEPPPGWVFFLTANDPTLLLPTIVSRCQTLRLKPFHQDELKELLKLADVPNARAQVAASLAQGSWSKARALSEDENWENRKAVFDLLEVPETAVPGLVDWAAQDLRHMNLLFDQLESISAELVRWSLTGEKPEIYAWVNADGKAPLVGHIRNALRALGTVENARDFWIARSERLAKARQESLLPLNKKLLVQDVLLPWLETIRK